MALLVYVALVLLLWLQHPIVALAMSEQEEEDLFVQKCPPSPCGSLVVRFPLRLRTSPVVCGLKDHELTCRGDDTLLYLPSSASPFKVKSIDYGHGLLTIDLGSSQPCPLRNLSFLMTPTYMLALDYDDVSLLSCAKELPTSELRSSSIVGPVSCLSSGNRIAYFIENLADISLVPSEYCTKTSTLFPFLNQSIVSSFESFIFFRSRGYSSFDLVKDITERKQANLRWSDPDHYSTYSCEKCEFEGKTCGFSWTTNQSFCIGSHPRWNVMIIAGTATGGGLVLLSLVLILLYIFRKSEKERETRLKVEKFLATYKTTKPKRYSFSEIKKITKQLSHKLGQGGYGSVYKGELPNGVPVAIKMLETSKGDGDDFINEVDIIGRLHHVNVVRLLGFCSEGTRHALIYEFMPKGSLEKFIFSEDAKRRRDPLTMEKLLEITIGIARGIEYLHQGCDQRILHFDIKPHNILLDYNFNPKISDFGLAKLCSRDRSIVTMTTARGTVGYIAPEIYSRNFGTVSYKSDVYSFGMLLMEMVSGKKNVDPVFENQVEEENKTDVYFPEWVYDQLINCADIGLSIGKTATEEEVVKKLLIVALWCIQWSPTDRPSMTRVIQLLMEDSESLQIPPKPFITQNSEDETFAIEV